MTDPEITIGGNVDEDRFIVYVDGEPTYTLTHELGRKVGNRPAPMVRTLRYIEERGKDRETSQRAWEFIRALEAELRITAR
jgi:hypothetical protein